MWWRWTRTHYVFNTNIFLFQFIKNNKLIIILIIISKRVCNGERGGLWMDILENGVVLRVKQFKKYI